MTSPLNEFFAVGRVLAGSLSRGFDIAALTYSSFDFLWQKFLLMNLTEFVL